jgi:hypothetical protein
LQVHGAVGQVDGVPSEEVLAQMRADDRSVHYFVVTLKGRLPRLEQALDNPWHSARPEVRVKLLAQDAELYLFTESRDRIAKERSMCRRQPSGDKHVCRF